MQQDTAGEPQSELSQELLALPGMTTQPEREQVYFHAKLRFHGEGQIVDLGSWLGSLTAALAEGLKNNPAPAARSVRVHAYDSFRYYDWMAEEFSRFGLPAPSREGDSFLPVFERITAPWKDHIEIHVADLEHATWTGGPIELLIVDAMKNWALTNSILRTFFPALIPGRSIVMHQDFAHYATPWIPLVMHRLRDYFEVDGAAAHSGGVSFRFTRTIPRELLEEDYGLESFSSDEINAAFEWAGSVAADDQQWALEAGRAVLQIESTRTTPAVAELARILPMEEIPAHIRNQVADRWLERHPGMTTFWERRLLTRLAQHEYRGEGAIVDLGSWLGSLSATLAEGLRRSDCPAARTATIHAYDSFRFYSWMAAEFQRYGLAVPEREGDTFLPVFEQFIAPWKSRIEVHEADLTQASWDGGPIELLIVDAMKNWELTNSIVHAFYPALIPGRSIVVHQDFAHFATPWILLTMHRLREYFSLVEATEHSGSVTFRLEKPIPEPLLKADYRLEDFSDEEIEAAWSWAASLISPDQQWAIEASRAVLLVEGRRWFPAALRLRGIRANPAIPEEIRRTIANRWVELHPGMSTHWDSQYLLHLATSEFQGQGTIVELGCWLGSLTASLAEGLNRNQAPAASTARVHAFDAFQILEWMHGEFARVGVPCSAKTQHSFRPLFEKLVAPWRERIEIHEADLEHCQWTGEPIELLVVDAMSTWELTSTIQRTFYPSLTPGRSLVVHLGFCDESTPWIVPAAYRLREFFEPAGGADHAGSCSFRLRQPIPQTALLQELSLNEFSSEDLDAAFAWAEQLAGPEGQASLSAGRILLDLEANRPDRGLERLLQKVACFDRRPDLLKRLLQTLSLRCGPVEVVECALGANRTSESGPVVVVWGDPLQLFHFSSAASRQGFGQTRINWMASSPDGGFTDDLLNRLASLIQSDSTDLGVQRTPLWLESAPADDSIDAIAVDARSIAADSDAWRSSARALHARLREGRLLLCVRGNFSWSTLVQLRAGGDGLEVLHASADGLVVRFHSLTADSLMETLRLLASASEAGDLTSGRTPASALSEHQSRDWLRRNPAMRRSLYVRFQTDDQGIYQSCDAQGDDDELQALLERLAPGATPASLGGLLMEQFGPVTPTAHWSLGNVSFSAVQFGHGEGALSAQSIDQRQDDGSLCAYALFQR